MPDLRVEKLCADYGGEAVLRDFSCDFSRPGAYAIMGGSGVGKTTLLRVLAGLMRPRSGALGDFPKLRRAVMFQEDRLLNQLTALGNVELVSDVQSARRWLEAVELADKADALPGELSGGQRRRVALARCAAFGGDLLLLDEPFTGLDNELKARIAPRLAAEFERIILSTHDADEAALFSASVLRLGT